MNSKFIRNWDTPQKKYTSVKSMIRTNMKILFELRRLMWYLVTEDQLRCFGRHNQNQKFTFKSSRPALKIWNILRHIGFKLMRLYSFEFLIVICVNVWLVYGQKAETVRIYHGNSMDITSGSKMLFSSWIWDGACNRTLHDSSLYESRAYAPKKRCGLWLTFFATWLRRSWMNEP